MPSTVAIDYEVAVIGAGPYGLSAAAQLKASGISTRVFGDPMSFWERHMPVGMFLRSNWTATQIADPNRLLTLEAYQAATGNYLPAGSGTSSRPVPLDSFIQYGRWYQREAVPDLDQRKVARVETNGEGFRITIEDRDVVRARRVVVAVGIAAFAWRPPEFEGLPRWLASHTSEHRDFRKFSGRRVLVIGGGQSALESAALLHESGAETEVAARSSTIHWLHGWASRTLHHNLGPIVRKVLYAPTDVGPAGISQLMARPDLLRRLPRWLQDRLRERAVRPAGASWLVNRLRDVPIRLGRRVICVETSGEGLKVRLDDRSERFVDHVLLGTGYRMDISKYDFIAPELLRSIRCFNGYPCLQEGLETSVPGLHILGAPAAWSFGPLMQFVSGTHYASRTLTRRIVEDGGQ